MSLLGCLGKLLERINNRQVWFLESQELLSFTETGYCQHRSTEDKLAFLTQNIENGLYDPRKEKTLVVFFDSTKAYDRVWIKGLLLKVMRMGIKGKMLDLMKNFLQSAWMEAQATSSNLEKECPRVE